MLAPIALLVFAVAMAAVGPRMLVRAAWVKRAPGWGVLAWQGLTASLVVAILMLGLVLAAPLSPLADAMAYMWATNVPEVVEHYLTPAGYGLASTAVVGQPLRVPREGSGRETTGDSPTAVSTRA